MSSKTKKAASGKAVLNLPQNPTTKNEDILAAKDAVGYFLSRLNPTLCYDPALDYFKGFVEEDAEALDRFLDALLVSEVRESIETVCDPDIYSMGIAAMHRIIRVLDRMVPQQTAAEVKKQWSLLSKTL